METKPALRGDVGGRRLQDELLVDILDHAPDAIGIVELVSAPRNKYVFLYVNAAFEPLYTANKREVIGADVSEFFTTRAVPGDLQKTLWLMAEGKPFTNTRTFTRADGSTVWLEVSYRPILAEDQPVRWIFIARDVTAKKLLQDRATQLSIAVEEGNDLVAISVADFDAGVGNRIWRFAYVNEAFTRTTGYRPDEIIGKSFVEIMPPGTRADAFAEIRNRLFGGEAVREEIKFVHKDGRIGIFVANIKPIADPITQQFNSIVTIFRDVTEERLYEARLQYEAEHDPLTGLHNRRYFERMLRDSVSMQQPATAQHALIFLDLDGFKEVNDRLGHEAGDEVLKAAASAFGYCITATDVLVRWGGDEFAALLFHCPIQSAERVAHRMLDELRRTPGRRWVTASVGVAAALPDEPPAVSIKRADRGAYAAKNAGGDRVVVLSE